MQTELEGVLGVGDGLVVLTVLMFDYLFGGALSVPGGAVGLAVMIGCGLAVGWQARGPIAATLAAIGLLLLLRFALIWVGIYLGLRPRCRHPRTVRQPRLQRRSWPAEHSVALAVAWPLLLVAVFLPLGVRRYRRLSH